MSRKIFVNLPIKNLERTKHSFKALGYPFNPKLTDDEAASVDLGFMCRRGFGDLAQVDRTPLADDAAEPSARASNAKIRAARILRALLVLFLLVDGAGKVLRLAPYVEGTAKVGFPPGALVPLGVVLIGCTALYVIPRTAVLGAVLLTGYFGGAIATHVRMGEPFVFPLVFGVLAWACVYVRDGSLHALLPVVRGGPPKRHFGSTKPCTPPTASSVCMNGPSTT